MLDPNVNHEKACEEVCRGLGFFDPEMWDMVECIDTLANDIYAYSHYGEIEAECKTTMENQREYYGQRILKALEALFCDESKDYISHAVESIINQ